MLDCAIDPIAILDDTIDDSTMICGDGWSSTGFVSVKDTEYIWFFTKPPEATVNLSVPAILFQSPVLPSKDEVEATSNVPLSPVVDPVRFEMVTIEVAS